MKVFRRRTVHGDWLGQAVYLLVSRDTRIVLLRSATLSGIYNQRPKGRDSKWTYKVTFKFGRHIFTWMFENDR